jgi:hypothetical protein
MTAKHKNRITAEYSASSQATTRQLHYVTAKLTDFYHIPFSFDGKLITNISILG